MKKDAKKRSPLKDPAMRNPGQSLAEARQELFEDYALLPALMASGFLVVAMIKWMEELTGRSTSPWAWTAVALAATAWFIYRIFKVRPRLRALRQGEQGERAVGQYLEKLRSDGYEVFHDLIGEGFNVDHVIIGPAGVFSIETKTWSKPIKGEAKIHFDGQRLSQSGQAPNRRPIIQAQAQGSWLQTLLQESTGRELKAHPVVLFPGWYIESEKEALNRMWVLEPKGLPKFLAHQPTKLSAEEIKLFSFHLSRWVRAEESRLQKH